jgi:hypothetical protein
MCHKSFDNVLSLLESAAVPVRGAACSTGAP